jgi:hypothetical protein
LKAFITHCGQNSLTESARAGVPVIGIPLFGDQFYNAYVAEERGIGIQIEVNDLNGPNAEKLFIGAIDKVSYFIKFNTIKMNWVRAIFFPANAKCKRRFGASKYPQLTGLTCYPLHNAASCIALIIK